MMSNKTADLEDGECCCCLERGEHRDVTKQYYWDEQPEIYEVLFKDTFDIVLKYPESTKLICECCIVKLREASHFRSIVESSQQSLIDCHNLQIDNKYVDTDLLQEIKSEDITYESDTQMEEVNNDVHSDRTVEQIHCDTHETDIKKENSVDTDLFQEIKSEDITYESDTQMEEVNNDVHSDHTVEQVHCDMHETDIKKEKSGPSSSSFDNLAITQDEIMTLEKTLSCQYCLYKTAYKGGLITHIRLSHTGKKPYSCKYCEYKTGCKGDYTKHIRTHRVEKSFSCEMCHFKSKFKGHLTKHLLTHRETKSFPCGYCEYETTESINLTRHILDTHSVAHSREKYMPMMCCNYCNYKTKYKSCLIMHTKRRHNKPCKLSIY